MFCSYNGRAERKTSQGEINYPHFPGRLTVKNNVFLHVKDAHFIYNSIISFNDWLIAEVVCYLRDRFINIKPFSEYLKQISI